MPDNKVSKRKSSFLTLIWITATFLMSYGVYAVITKTILNPEIKVGKIIGVVENHDGNKIPALVAIAGTQLSAKANNDGEFVIDQVPRGEYDIIFLNDKYGWEIQIVVKENQILDLGVVKIPFFEVEN